MYRLRTVVISVCYQLQILKHLFRSLIDPFFIVYVDQTSSQIDSSIFFIRALIDSLTAMATRKEL